MPDIDINVSPEQDTTTQTSTVGGRIMSPASKAALDAEHKANVAVADAAKAVGEAKSLQETVRADMQDQASTLLRQQAADQAAEFQHQRDRIETARAAAAQAEDAFANHKFHDYWSRQGVGKRIASAFGLFFGGTGSGLVGGSNPAADALYRDMDRDFAIQKQDLDSKRQRAGAARSAVGDTFQQEAQENAALAIKFAKANEATAAEMVQRLTEAGIPLAQAEANQAVAGLRARAEEKRREALQLYDTSYSNSTVTSQKTGDPNKGPTEAQAKTSLTAEQMADSLAIIRGKPPLSPDAVKRLKNNELAMQAADTEAGKDMWGNLKARGARAMGVVPESKYEGLSADEQQVANAWDNVKELYVRQFTGAGMPETEALRAAEQYGPRPGDSPELIQQKFQRQERMVEQMRAQSPAGTAAMNRAGVQREGAPPQRQGAPGTRRQRIPAADIRLMQQARSRGDHRFDALLKAEGM